MSEKLDIFLKLPKKAQELYFDNKDYCVVDCVNGKKINRIESCSDDFRIFQECESPIEIIMLMALEICECKRNIWDRYHYGIIISTQIEYEIGDSKYRSDITIYVDDVFNTTNKNDFEIIIECDGHDFHEKTKEQVIKNNQRDYDFKCAGIEVFHFSGSEIYNKPTECADKIFDYIEGRINKCMTA